MIERLREIGLPMSSSAAFMSFDIASAYRYTVLSIVVAYVQLHVSAAKTLLYRSSAMI